jgi:hypothetical protein
MRAGSSASFRTLVGADGATREAGDVTFGEFALTHGRPQRRAAAKDDQPFLVRVMEVVRPQFLARVDLVHAPADQVGAESRADLGLANAKALVLHLVAALDGEEVDRLHRGNR